MGQGRDHRTGEHKASKGLIRVEFDVSNGRAENVRIMGDFFMYPEEAVDELEKLLEGSRLDDLEDAMLEFFKRRGVQTPGAGVEDFLKALRKALGGREVGGNG